MNNNVGLSQMSGIVRCSKCEKYKMSSEFNKDNSKSNGLTSYCKECNIKSAKEWKVQTQIKKEQSDLVELYRQAYAEGYYKSTSQFETSRRKDARDYANELFPEAGQAIEQYTLYTRSKGTIPKTPQIELGNILMHNLRGLLPKGKKKSSNPIIPASNDSDIHRHQNSVTRKYETWIVSNDYIPSDEFIAHFCGVTIKHIGDTRSDFRKAGYDFEQVENGWIVIKRPTQAIDIDNLSVDEVKSLIKRLAMMI